MLTDLWFIADAVGTPNSIEGVLFQYGAIGVCLLALGLYARGQIKATEERCRRFEDKYEKLNELILSQMMPALTRANDILGAATTIIADIKGREEKQAAIDEARRAFDDERKRREGGGL